MIADEITIIEERVKLDLILELVDKLDLDALEGCIEGRTQAESIRDNVRHIMRVLVDALRDTRETIRRSSKHWRPFTPELKNAVRDSAIMEQVQKLASELSESKEYGDALKFWLEGGAKGTRPQPPKMVLHFGRVSQEARQHADRRLRAAVAAYEKTEQAKERGTRGTTA